MGDTATICFKKFNEQTSCDLAVKAKVAAYLQKMPGLVEVSYLNVRFSMSPLDFPVDGVPSIVMTEQSYLRLISLAGGDASQMPIRSVITNLDDENLTFNERVKLNNKLKRFLPDLNVFAADQAVFENAVSKKFVMADVFSSVLTFYAFVLCFFQILIAVGQNLKETGWQLGVLRSIGITKYEKFKIAQLEAFVNILVALCLGIGIGSITAVL